MWSSRSRRQLSIQRSATPFCQGLSKEVRTGLIFMDRTAFRIPVEDQKPGRRLEWKRLPELLNDAQARRMVCDIEMQDAPTIVADDEEAAEHTERNRWHDEEVHGRNRFPMVSKEGEPTLGRLRISRRSFHSTGDRSLGRSKPSMRSSPCIRGAPQLGFSATIWKINSRTSFGVRLLPTCVRTLEISLQYIRKPVRCQRTTVSGVTTMRACFHPDQNRRTTTQKSLSSRPMLGRRCRRFSTASCCRSTRFSNSRFPRLRKRRISAPIQRRMGLNMARSYIRSTIGKLVVSC